MFFQNVCVMTKTVNKIDSTKVQKIKMGSKTDSIFATVVRQIFKQNVIFTYEWRGFYDETGIMVMAFTFFTLLQWPWHWAVLFFH